MDMPFNYIVEMICDWWSFSWSKGDLTEIFTWYDEHKDYIKLSNYTRRNVENILRQIKRKLNNQKGEIYGRKKAYYTQGCYTF